MKQSGKNNQIEFQYFGKVIKTGSGYGFDMATDLALNSEIGELLDQDIEIIIRKKKKTRSSQLNRTYWKFVVQPIQMALRDVGERLSPTQVDQLLIDVIKNTTKETVHEMLKDKFAAKEEVDEDTGEVNTLIPSTRRMNNAEFCLDYLPQIEKWAAEFLGITILYPSDEPPNYYTR